MRRLLHGFFALAMLLSGIGAESAFPEPAAVEDCCCGDAARCPCDMPRAPQGPRGRCATPPPVAAPPSTPAARSEVRRQAETEPRPWNGMAGLTNLAAAPASQHLEALPAPRGDPPPQPQRERLARLATFRI